MLADTPSSATHMLSPLGRGLKAVAQFYGVALQPNILSRQQFGHEEILSIPQAKALLKAAHFPSRTHTKTEVLTHACPALVFEKGKKKTAETFLGLYLPTANQILTWAEGHVIPTIEPSENHPLLSRKNLVFLAIFEPKKQPVKELSWFWDGFRKNRGLLGEVLLCNFFINLMTLAIPLFTMNVYDKVMPTFASSTLWVLTMGAALAVGIDVSFRLVRSRLLGRLQHDCAQMQDITLLQSVLNFKGLPTSASARGELFQTLARAREGLVNSILPTVLDIPFILIFIAVIGMLSPVLMWIPICLILFIVAVQTFLTFRYQHLTHTDVQARQKREHFLALHN